ncbi:uncharacterized protein PV09_08158 [Verruconis gallopava]|uniref:Uncharacterized protein n=1 Tax=Verruconis gallopava TaxID=253628 RepID=A0A0D2A0S8_9PEZI|nr:uncharacterized protein PV09_08158 [Verruconis gallopava]KIW00268.1 hypothetical protein PV09_08158 [Verruconis gallopava]
MTLFKRDDPFSSEPEGAAGEEGGTLITFARILAFLFAAVLSWILYRVITGAWRQYKHNSTQSLFGRRRGAYRRIPTLRLHRPEEDGYRDEDEELDVDDTPSALHGRGKGKAMDYDVDEGFHDGESSLDIRRSADVWKDLPERPLPDKPLPDVPRG